MRIGIAGSGAWGTALAVMLYENGHEVTLWSFFREESEALASELENKYLPGIRIPAGIRFTWDISDLGGRDIILMVPPSFAFGEVADRLAPHIGGAAVVSATKGLMPDGTLFSEMIKGAKPGKVCVLSGPSHAEEVAAGVPTAVVLAARDVEVAETVQDALMNEKFRVYTNDDFVGVQLGGALKNVAALACGMCEGLGYGDNTRAALITRFMTEMARLCLKMGGKSETLSGLSGMGDLIVTCMSMHSRNRRAGILLGRGRSLEETQREVGSTIESLYAVKAGYETAKKYGAEMPILNMIHDILYSGYDIGKSMRALMTRTRKHETEICFMTVEDV